MADFNLIKIGDTYLTDDGLITGDPCMTEVQGLGQLLSNKIGAVQFTANNVPKIFSAPSVGQGSIILITAFVIDSTTHEAIMDEINALDLEGGDTITIEIEGLTGNFEFTAVPALPQLVEFPGTFSDTWIDQMTYRFVVKELV